MITGIIIGILVWQAVILILLLTDKLDSDAGSLFASGIFGLIGICIAATCRFIYRNVKIRRFNKNFVKGILYDKGSAIQAFYIPKKDIDFFCTDETQESYVKISEAERKNTMPERSEIMTIEKATNGVPGWSSKYMAKFIKNS